MHDWVKRMENEKQDQNLVRIVEACQSIATTYGTLEQPAKDPTSYSYTYTDKNLTISYAMRENSMQMNVTFRNKPLDRLMFRDLVECLDYVIPLYTRSRSD
jgi:hypothetical protein